VNLLYLEVVLFSFLSSFSRSILNIIDRYTFGHLKKSVAGTSFINNYLPLLLLLVICSITGNGKELLQKIISFKIICIAFLIQMVSYAYSLAFKHANIHKVIVISKLSDIFIPIGIFLIVGSWNWLDYGFAILTTIVCIPIIFQKSDYKNKTPLYIVLAVIVVLVLQGSLSSVLVDKSEQTIVNSILITTAIMFWRFCWSFFVYYYHKEGSLIEDLLDVRLVALFRCLTSISTQLFFILALSYTTSPIAWPIFNSTILFSVGLSALILKEKATKLEYLVIASIFLITSFRLILN